MSLKKVYQSLIEILGQCLRISFKYSSLIESMISHWNPINILISPWNLIKIHWNIIEISIKSSKSSVFQTNIMYEPIDYFIKSFFKSNINIFKEWIFFGFISMRFYWILNYFARYFVIFKLYLIMCTFIVSFNLKILKSRNFIEILLQSSV